MLCIFFYSFQFLDAGRQYLERELARDDAIPSAKETPPVDSIDDDLSHGKQSPDGLFGRRHALSPLGGTTHRLPHDNARAHEATANTGDSRREPLTRSLSPDRFVNPSIPTLADCSSHMKNAAAIVNAIIMFVTFLTTIPALLMPTSRMWLKLHGYLVFACAMVSMVIGLVLWFDTLKTRSNLSTVWAAQPQDVQSLLQQKVR